jgi:hypothetical protein
VRITFRGKNPSAFAFARSRRADYLARYVLREHSRGRPLADVLEDPYVRNRSTPADRARLLERPEVVAAIGEQALAELRGRRRDRGAAVPVP